jgi:uncharacterized membrane protein YgcG
MREHLLGLVLLLVPVLAWPAERITSFHAELEVQDDATLRVVETIAVRAEGHKIRRGIFRDFPTTYRDRGGHRYTVTFDLVAVTRDGEPEDHFTENVANGVRVYIGNENRILPAGSYTYTITYLTARQLGFFESHDELYWNVTGNGWEFPIHSASAAVRLPDTIKEDSIRLEAYTGPVGAQGQSYTAWLDEGGEARFATTKALGPGDGLTIVVAWPKGHVVEPTTGDRLEWFLYDNVKLLVGFTGAIVLLVYYMLCWNRVGRDPEIGVVIPRYEPPRGYSPASMRFVRRMGYDHKTFTSAIVNLAAKGHLRIEEKDGTYALMRTDATGGELAPGEATIMRRLFSIDHRVPLEKWNHRRIKQAIDAHENRLKANYEKLYFKANSGYTVLGVLLSLLTLAAVVLLAEHTDEMAASGFLILWLSGWTFGVLMLGGQVYRAWRGADGVGSVAGAMAITLFAIPFFVGEVVGLVMLGQAGGVAVAAILAAMIFINWLFHELMKSPTRLGRKLLDRVDGFRDFLNVAERDELAFKHPPEKTPELFERYLPYAMALDVEQAWGDKFARVIAEAERSGDYGGPDWYEGSEWDDSSLGSFSESLGSSLSSSIAASSTAPGSSSGSGGGGSSGGGGGGGGGGGW